MPFTERPPNSVFDDDTERVERPLKISVTKLWGLTFVLPTLNFRSFKDFYKVATTHNLVSFSNV